MTTSLLHTVTGATGYTGRYITHLLLEQGHTVQSITGHPDRHNPFGNQVPLHPFDFENPEKLTETLAGTDTLFNTYWIRVNYGGRTHEQCVEQTRVMFDAAKTAGVRRIVHISITNPDPNSDLPYFRGKGQLEDALRSLGVSHAILRPTVLYSVEDILLNNIAWTVRKFPMVPLPGNGNYGIQPVFVEDLAQLAVRHAAGNENVEVDAVGPEVFTYAEMVRLVRDKTGSRCWVSSLTEAVHLPGWPNARLDAEGHRPHQRRDQGTVPRSARLEVRRTGTGTHQAHRMARPERRTTRRQVRQRSLQALRLGPMDFIDAFGGFLIGSFAVIIFFVVIPGIVALVAGVLLGVTAAIPIVLFGALNYLVPRDSKAENADDASMEKT